MQRYLHASAVRLAEAETALEIQVGMPAGGRLYVGDGQIAEDATLEAIGPLTGERTPDGRLPGRLAAVYDRATGRYEVFGIPPTGARMRVRAEEQDGVYVGEAELVAANELDLHLTREGDD